MKRPTSFVLGPSTWTIEWVAPQDESLLGSTDQRFQIIRVDPRQHEDGVRETLLHEMLHACHLMVGLADDTNCETFISVVSPTLLSVLRANPEIARYLLR
jgi:hypothetical protein